MSVFAPASRFETLIYRHIRIIHVIKISLALLIAHLLNLFYPVPYLAWTSVTIVIIMLTLPQVGGALEKSIQRVIGTLCGAAYGILVLWLTHDPWLSGFLALLAIAFITWRASGKMSYAYLVAGFTLMIVLDGGDRGMDEAIWRTATIMLGCVIAILVSQFVLPLRARNEWRWLLAFSLRGMSHVWQSHLSPNIHKPVQTRGRLKQLQRTVQRQRGLLNSVRMESRTLRPCGKELEALVEVQERCLLLLELLAQSRWENSASAQAIQQQYAISVQARTLGERLTAFACFCAGEQPLLPEASSEQGLKLKQMMLENLEQQQSHSLNAYGYSWLIYQTSLQITLMEKLIRGLAMSRNDH
jgi:uncharacterized membrane protein YccC